MTVSLVAGAGYTGKRIARLLCLQGQQVYGLISSEAGRSDLGKDGILPLIGDIRKKDSFEELPSVDCVVICLAPRERNEAAYEQLYLKGIANLLQRVRRQDRPARLLYLSSTGVWPEGKGEWVDEKVVPKPDSWRGRILFRAEEQIMASGSPFVILRLGGIYGPGRNRIEALKSGAWPEKGPDRYLNMIHVEDAAAAAVRLIEKGKEGSVYIGVDEEPVLQSKVYGWLCRQMDISARNDLFDGPGLAGKRCRNKQFTEFGFSFRYPTFREGYGELIKQAV